MAVSQQLFLLIYNLFLIIKILGKHRFCPVKPHRNIYVTLKGNVKIWPQVRSRQVVNQVVSSVAYEPLRFDETNALRFPRLFSFPSQVIKKNCRWTRMNPGDLRWPLRSQQWQIWFQLSITISYLTYNMISIKQPWAESHINLFLSIDLWWVGGHKNYLTWGHRLQNPI